ncbi:glutamyl-tRNA reductase [Candidatus Alkanophaga liquidiphilum]|nr:Glutamyl-tRNA reductase [Candidatus Alkanophaga liquidiphilum]
MMELACLLITHKRATLPEIETAFFNLRALAEKETSGEDASVLQRLCRYFAAFDGVEECVVLHTCNRLEIYAAGPKCKNALERLAAVTSVRQKTEIKEGRGAAEHLLRVAAGLEAMIVGEDQILGQVRQCFEEARAAGTVGETLSVAFNRAIRTGKRARSETKINEGAISIGSAAVELAKDVLGDLHGRDILVVGAGEMGTLVAKALSEEALSAIYVANRTFSRAEALAAELGGYAVRFDDIEKYLEVANVVISATGAPHTVIKEEMVRKAMSRRGGKKLIIIDIANPRDVEESVSLIENVELYNIDALRGVSEQNLKMRLQEVPRVEAIIKRELELLEEEYRKREAERLLKHIYRLAEEIRTQEAEKALKKLCTVGNSPSQEQKYREIIEGLTHSLVYKLLANTTASLKEAAINGDGVLLEAAKKFFKLS